MERVVHNDDDANDSNKALQEEWKLRTVTMLFPHSAQASLT
jgi:hypothetical protein